MAQLIVPKIKNKRKTHGHPRLFPVPGSSSSCGERRGSAVRHTFCLLFLKSSFSCKQKKRGLLLATLEFIDKRELILEKE